MYFRMVWPETSSPCLFRSLEARAFYKATQSSGRPYDLFSTGLLTEDVMGQGVMQYFSWTAWMMVISLALALCAYFRTPQPTSEQRDGRRYYCRRHFEQQARETRYWHVGASAPLGGTSPTRTRSSSFAPRT